MADIYGRSTSRSKSEVTIAMVKKLINEAMSKITDDDIKKTVQDGIEEILNLTEVDPDELIVFAEREKRTLKTSNISINDILTTTKGISENI